jgi:two-component system, NtrC family, sensor kinase
VSKVTIKQPLVLYATVFMLLFASVVVTIDSFSTVNASRRAYRRALRDQLTAIAAKGTARDVRRAISTRVEADVELGVVTADEGAPGITLAMVREAVQSPEKARTIAAVRLTGDPEEAYVFARYDPTIPSAIGFVEVGRSILPILIAALLCAALLGFMLRRLLVPSLSALAEIARDPTIRPPGLAAADAPNEILEIAQTFRHTVRQLSEEREKIAAQHRELEAMQAHLIRASKLASVGRLAAGIAHEIGNPLAAVQGYLALLPRLDENEKAEVLERSARELKRIHETIKKLLAYARQDEALEPPAPLATAAIVRDAILLVRGHPAMRGIEVAQELGAENETDAKAHAGRLGQVLVNLLLNAAQAMSATEQPRIEIKRTIADGFVDLAVRDNGPGIPSDKLEQIFDPFYTTKAPGEGTGLGLAVSRSLVEAMEGDLLVESELGKGACFTVRLKRA